MPISEAGVAVVQTQQNYLGVLGIIWRTGCDFPIIGSCDRVLLAVCAWNDSWLWWEIRKWSLFTSLSAIHMAMVFILSLLPLLLHSGHIFFTQNKVKQELTHDEGYSYRKLVWWPNEHIDFHLLLLLSCRDAMCLKHFEWSGLCSQDLFKMKNGYYRCAAYLYAAQHCGLVPGI